jgi:hypothetical protein
MIISNKFLHRPSQLLDVLDRVRDYGRPIILFVPRSRKLIRSTKKHLDLESSLSMIVNLFSHKNQELMVRYYLCTVGDEEHERSILLTEPLAPLFLLLLDAVHQPTVEAAAHRPAALPAAGGPWRWRALKCPGHVRGGLVVIRGTEHEGPGPRLAEVRLFAHGVVVAHHCHGVVVAAGGRQVVVLDGRLVIGAAEEVVHGGLRCGGVEGVEELEAELRGDGRDAGGGGKVRVAGVQVKGVVAHQELALRVIHAAACTLKTTRISKIVGQREVKNMKVVHKLRSGTGTLEEHASLKKGILTVRI